MEYKTMLTTSADNRIELWVSTDKFTGFASVQNNIIIDATPFIFKFVGQPLKSMTDWLLSKPSFGEIKIEILK